MRKIITAITLLLALTSHAQKTGYYICTDMDGGEAPSMHLDPNTGELTYSNAVSGHTLKFQKTLSLTCIDQEGWPINTVISNAPVTDVIDVPIKEVCPWIDSGDAYICERPQIWNTTEKEMWLEVVLGVGSGMVADKVVETLVTKAVGHAIPSLGLALGIKTAAEIIGTLPEASGLDAYTKLLFMNEGEEIDPDKGIPYGEELSLMVFCRPAVTPDEDYASDFVTGLTIEKFNNTTKHWEEFQSIDLMSSENGASRTHDHLLLAKEPFTFDPGSYRIKVEEITGFSEESYTFHTQTQITVTPSPEAGGEQKFYSCTIGTDYHIQAIEKEGWEFVRWRDNGNTNPTRVERATSTPAEYIAEFKRTDGLVAYYPFDGDAQDYSGNGNHGTKDGVEDIAGKIGTAYYFNTGKRVTVPHSDSIDFGNENFSLTAWIKIGDEYSSGDIHIIDKRTGGGDAGTGYDWFVRDGNISIALQSSSLGTRLHLIGGNVDDGIWHLVSSTINRSTQTCALYIDGQLSISASISSGSIGNTGQTCIGSRFTDNKYFIGSMDEVRIYNRTLSVFELQQLYQDGQ